MADRNCEETKFPDWEFLQLELLDLILSFLDDPSDFLAFALVCKQWLHVVVENKYRLDSFSRLPFLLIPSRENSPESQKRGLFDIRSNKCCNFELDLSPYCNRRFCGSSHGWLAITEKDYSITLFNPFTRDKIHLPPVRKYNKRTSKTWEDYEYYVDKVVLSANPLLVGDNYEVAAIFEGATTLAIIQPNKDKKWTCVNIAWRFHEAMCDVIYYKGKAHAVNQFGNMVVSLSAKDKRSINGNLQVVVRTAKPGHSIVNTITSDSYIVESHEGDLLLLIRYFTQRRITIDGQVFRKEAYSTGGFEVFKLKNENEWCKVESLDEQAIFLGENHSLCVCASSFPGLQLNSIYYTDDSSWMKSFKEFGPHDIGIFNIGDKSTKKHYVIPHKHIPPTIWLLPTMQGKLEFS